MRLRKLKVKSFKAIRDITIDLTDATLLVGSNNSGKSSVLQAVHFAARAMLQASEANKQSTISLRDLEYVPSESYRELGHNALWGNRWESPESVVTYVFEDEITGALSEAKIALKSARNEGISVDPTIPAALIPTLRSQTAVFSSYIPGLAGIPLQEQFISRRNVYRKAASGDSNVVLRNILLILQRKNELSNAVQAVREVYADESIGINIDYDDERDYNISATIHTRGMTGFKPLELAGTGILQVIQIFSYLYLFRPSIILIDEPEAHLHPTLQTRLMQVLQKRVKAAKSTALITTHSPFIARGLGDTSQTTWIESGKVAASGTGTSIRDALGWGALDRKVIVCAEDRDTRPLEAVLSQDQRLARDVAVVPFSGVSKLGSAAALQAFRAALGNHHKMWVYRDRDCLTDGELDRWFKEYADAGFGRLVSSGVEIENEYLDVGNVAVRLGLNEGDIVNLLSEVEKSYQAEFIAKFKDKRREANSRFYKDGGSPDSMELWDASPPHRRLGGKMLMAKLYTELEKRGIDRKAVDVTDHAVTIGLPLLQQARSLLLS